MKTKTGWVRWGVLGLFLLILTAFIVNKSMVRPVDIVSAINNRAYKALEASNRIHDDRLSDQEKLALDLMMAYGYETGSQIRAGDLSIMMKAYYFTAQCVQRGWINKKLMATNPNAMLELLHRTFTDKEITLLKCEIDSVKGHDASDRDQILKDAGYSDKSGL